MPLVVTAVGDVNAVVAAALVQYVKVPPPVLPAVTAGNVKFTVDGEQTAAGLVILKTGAGFIVTVTGSMSKQEPAVLLI